MQKFRILHCLRAPVGGLFRHVRDLSAAQAAAGHDVAVLADSVTADKLTEVRLVALQQHLKLGLHRTSMSRDIGWHDVTATRAALGLARNLKIDVIHGHGAKGGAYGRLAGGRLKSMGQPVKVFYTPHGGSLHYAPSSLKGRIFMALERRLARATDGIIFESAYSAEVYSRNVASISCPHRVIPNGLLAAEFVEHTPLANASDILFIGELRYLKGVAILLQAIAEAGSEVTATIVGDGPDAPDFHALTASLGLGSRVSFVGAMPAAQAFSLGRILVMPSLAESFPYIVLEAAAVGIPLLASSVGGIPEITSGTDTVLLPPGNVAELRGAITDALADLPSTVKRAERLKASVSQRFRANAMAHDILDFYNSAFLIESLRAVS